MPDKKVEQVAEFLGEGFHTAFRKATEDPQAHRIWDLISKMDGSEWHAVLMFVAEPLVSGWDQITETEQGNGEDTRARS